MRGRTIGEDSLAVFTDEMAELFQVPSERVFKMCQTNMLASVGHLDLVEVFEFGVGYRIELVRLTGG